MPRESPAGPAGHPQLAYFGLLDGAPADSAISIIRDRILDLTLAPGSRVDDRLLMDRFGMGRTPAREAFNRLAAEGLIVIQRNRGAFVRPLDIQHVRQFFDAYVASERVVGYYCRADDTGLLDSLQAIDRGYQEAYARQRFLEMTQLNGRFHGRIAVATQNEYIAEHALRLYNHARRLSYFIYLTEKAFIRDLHEMQNDIKADHDTVIDAVRRRDTAGLIDILTQHATLFHRCVMRIVAATRGASAPLPVAYDAGGTSLPATRCEAQSRPRAQGPG